MSIEHSAEQEEKGTRQRIQAATHNECADEAGRVGEEGAGYSRSLLGHSSLQGRGNAEVRAAVMRSAQQAHGNHVVQRYMQSVSSAGMANALDGEDALATRIEAASGVGDGLQGAARQKLEGVLGADLSGVRIHTDKEADRLSRSVNARAFTSGRDIFFREGEYDPGSHGGLRVLAHEVAHTVQQEAGPVDGTPGPGGVSISDPSDQFEQAAEKAADTVVSGRDASRASAAPTTAVQRMDDDWQMPGSTPMLPTTAPSGGEDPATPVSSAPPEESPPEEAAPWSIGTPTPVPSGGGFEDSGLPGPFFNPTPNLTMDSLGNAVTNSGKNIGYNLWNGGATLGEGISSLSQDAFGEGSLGASVGSGVGAGVAGAGSAFGNAITTASANFGYGIKGIPDKLMNWFS